MSLQQAQQIHNKQLQKWQRFGHEPVFERGTVRLAGLKKTLPPDLEVTVLDPATNEYVPFILTCGRPLLCGEVLPERADLALDEQGRLLNQAEFRARYEVYLDAFVYVEGSDTGFEPVPNVVNFVKETPDIYSESPGMIEIGFDPKLNEEFKPRQKYGPDGQSEEEYLRDREDRSDIAAALKSIADTQRILAEKMQSLEAPPEEPVEPQGMTAQDAVAATADTKHEEAPCGKRVKAGYVKQHKRKCNDDSCGGDGDNVKKAKK